MSVSIKPLHVSVFFHDHLQGHKAQRKTPWRWSWKKTETCRGFILTNTFLTFYWF